MSKETFSIHQAKAAQAVRNEETKQKLFIKTSLPDEWGKLKDYAKGLGMDVNKDTKKDEVLDYIFENDPRYLNIR